MKTTENKNPLFCDIETGMCGAPHATGTGEETNLSSSKKPVKIVYFTDPICSSCWGIEPQLRKLKLEYGDYFEIDYHMGGLLPSWSVYSSGGISKPSDVAPHWEEAGAYYEMPIDGDVWFEDPFDSSYPPSIAVKAAELQGKEKGISFMRRLREMLFLKKKNITKWEHLLKAAGEVGLDTFQFKTDYEGKANELFQEDLDLGKQLGVRGFPTLFFTDGEHNPTLVYGFRPYEDYVKAIKNILPDVQKRQYDKSPLGVFSYFNTLMTKEFAVLTEMNLEDADKVLHGLLDEGKISSFRSKNGMLWVF
ncbi:ClpXP adapter SpxH family protein [Pedobacter nyackensis]|uniref:ClpXP adapter SpxH family protein n=1 Tax=Pedobacter nyackensis TaxID=475255 RepID=UPI00292F3AC8|nr:DsbA family protein [Pedobacter nyackensis]